MRRIIPFLGVVVLVLALAPPAHATSDTMYLYESTTLTEDHHGAIYIDADGVTLDCAGHTVFGPGEYGFWGGVSVAAGRAGVTVKNCTVTGFDVNGIFGGGPDGRYEGNVVYGNAAHGMGIDSVSGNVLVGNTVYSNGSTGIVVTHFVGGQIRDNVVHDNPNWAGIALFDGSNGNLVTGNTSSGNYDGFEVIGSSGNVLAGNSSHANAHDGFNVRDGGGNSLSQNEATENGWIGVELSSADQTSLTENIAERNPFSGFSIERSSGVSFTRNIARRNGTGLDLHWSSGNVFKGNRFLRSGPEGWGVWVADSSNNNRFEGNIAQGNDYEGFAFAFGSSENEIINNVSEGSNYEGIALYYDANDNLVRGNVVVGNAHGGIVLNDSYGNSIIGNRAMANNQDDLEGAAGIVLREQSSYNEISRNTACGNGWVDAYEDGSGRGNVWQGNRFCTTEFLEPPGCVAPPEGLVGWWSGDDTTADLVGGHAATPMGNASYGSGKVGRSFALDGDGDFVDVPGSDAFDFGTGEFTVDFWVRFRDLGGEQVMIEKWVQRFGGPSSGWTFTKLEDNSVGFAVSSADGSEDGITTDPLDLPWMGWIHFAAVRTDAGYAIFMNGEQIAAADASGSPVDVSSTATLKFGHRGNPTDTPGSEDDRGFFLNGSIDEVEIFDRALSAEEVYGIWAAGSAGKCRT